MEISHILASKPSKIVSVKRSSSIRTAVSLLAEYRIGALIVRDEAGDLCGILSERDIVRWIAKNEDVLAQAVGDVMTGDVVVGVPQDDIISVAHVMTERRFRHLPVIDDNGTVIGMISIGDVMKAQRDEYRGEIDTLETQIMAGEE